MAPTQRDMDPALSIYVEAVAKFAKVVVRSTDATLSLQFRVEVAATLKDALAILPAVERASKPEVVVIFSYDTQGKSLYVRSTDVISINVHPLRRRRSRGGYFQSP